MTLGLIPSNVSSIPTSYSCRGASHTSSRTPHEIWFDPRHQGVLRILDKEACTITGYDPGEPEWWVSFHYPSTSHPRQIEVDFHTKRTHHGRKRLTATFTHRRTRLHWSDGNIWYRVREGQAMKMFLETHIEERTIIPYR